MANGESEWKWKPKFFSEFSMGELDFRRFDAILKEVDLCSGIVNSCQIPRLESMQNYFAHLVNLYDYWKPLISYKNVEEEIENLINESKKYKRDWENLTNNNLIFAKMKILKFVDNLNLLKTKLYTVKQFIGLGIVVKKSFTPEERIGASFNRNKSTLRLPEQ